MVVVAAGAVEHRRRGGGSGTTDSRTSLGPRVADAEPARFVGGSRIETRDLEQVHIALAMDGTAARSEPVSACRCSRLCWAAECPRASFQEVREQRGLCYAIYAFHAPYSDIGMFGLYAGTDAADVGRADARRRGRDQCARPKRINEAEVARAKAQMKAGLLMALGAPARAPSSSRGSSSIGAALCPLVRACGEN